MAVGIKISPLALPGAEIFRGGTMYPPSHATHNNPYPGTGRVKNPRMKEIQPILGKQALTRNTGRDPLLCSTKDSSRSIRAKIWGRGFYQKFRNLSTIIIVLVSLQKIMSFYVFDAFEINTPKVNHCLKEKYLYVHVGTL